MDLSCVEFNKDHPFMTSTRRVGREGQVDACGRGGQAPWTRGVKPHVDIHTDN